ASLPAGGRPAGRAVGPREPSPCSIGWRIRNQRIGRYETGRSTRRAPAETDAFAPTQLHVIDLQVVQASLQRHGALQRLRALGKRAQLRSLAEHQRAPIIAVQREHVVAVSRVAQLPRPADADRAVDWFLPRPGEGDDGIDAFEQWLSLPFRAGIIAPAQPLV